MSNKFTEVSIEFTLVEYRVKGVNIGECSDEVGIVVVYRMVVVIVVVLFLSSVSPAMLLYSVLQMNRM